MLFTFFPATDLHRIYPLRHVLIAEVLREVMFSEVLFSGLYVHRIGCMSCPCPVRRGGGICPVWGGVP